MFFMYILKVDYLFRQGDKSIYYAALYIVVSIQILALIGVIIILVKLEESKKKSLTVVYYTVRLLSFYALLLITIGPLPMSHIFLRSIICQDDDPFGEGVSCYTGVRLANTIAGAVGMFFVLFFSIIVQSLYIDFNPSSNIPFAKSQPRLGLIKLVFKLCLPVYIIMDEEVILQL